MKVIGIHGFNTDGQYIRKLEPYFKSAGYDYEPFIYGKPAITTLGNLILNRLTTKSVYNNLIKVVTRYKEVTLVGHSHGFRLAWGVQNVCSNVKCVLGFNGALDDYETFKCKVINCYHPDDWVLKIGAEWRPFSKWGSYGAKPIPSADCNFNLGNYFDHNVHSEVFNQLDLVMPDVLIKLDEVMTAP